MRFGVWEILLIIVLVLVLFGGAKLAGVGKNLGRGIKEFKEEIKDTDDASDQNIEAVAEDTEKKEAKNSEPDA
jgi:sec-independent protein translocase protein TatA